MENNNEAQEVNQETKTQDANFKEVELRPISFDDMTGE